MSLKLSQDTMVKAEGFDIEEKSGGKTGDAVLRASYISEELNSYCFTNTCSLFKRIKQLLFSFVEEINILAH